MALCNFLCCKADKALCIIRLMKTKYVTSIDVIIIAYYMHGSECNIVIAYNDMLKDNDGLL